MREKERGGYDNSDVDSDDQSEQLLIFSSNRDVCEFGKLLRTYKCDDGTKHGRKKNSKTTCLITQEEEMKKKKSTKIKRQIMQKKKKASPEEPEG